MSIETEPGLKTETFVPYVHGTDSRGWPVYEHHVLRGTPDEYVYLEVTVPTCIALKLPSNMTKGELADLLTALRDMPDADFPKGKWATIQHLQSRLMAPGIRARDALAPSA
jgi:hypothetical protein